MTLFCTIIVQYFFIRTTYNRFYKKGDILSSMDSENYNIKINKHDYETMKSSDFLKTLKIDIQVLANA